MTDIELTIAMAKAKGWKDIDKNLVGFSPDKSWCNRIPNLDHWAWDCVVDLSRNLLSLQWFEGEPDFGVFDDDGQLVHDSRSPDPAVAVCTAWLAVFTKEATP